MTLVTLPRCRKDFTYFYIDHRKIVDNLTPYKSHRTPSQFVVTLVLYPLVCLSSRYIIVETKDPFYKHILKRPGGLTDDFDYYL